MTPLAMACPHAEVIEGRVTDLALDDNRAEVKTDGGLQMSITYDHVVVAVGAVPRTLPVPTGSSSTLLVVLSVPRCSLLAEPGVAAPRRGRRRPGPGAQAAAPHLCFRGRRLRRRWRRCQSCATWPHDALRCYPALVDVPQRWVLVDAAPKILAEIPSRLGHYVYGTPAQAAGTCPPQLPQLEKVVDGRTPSLSDGTELEHWPVDLAGRSQGRTP